MSDLPPLRFDDFELDEANARLTRAGAPIALPPKAFALLCALARAHGKLATKGALLDAVWGHRHVSESVLKTTIAQVRAALADNAAEPRFIETVARRGYRFIGNSGPATRTGQPPPAAAAVRAPAPTTESASPAAAMIGRVGALARLSAAWDRAQRGERQLVWVAGDAGIGKTTLIDKFAAEAGADVVAHGQCIEQFGAGEPYLPMLEALKVLTRRTPDIVPLMRQVAPTWFVQMPWLIADADRGALQSTLAGAGQERMVRELWELLERYTQQHPLLLVTEDLHWSDQGTLRLLDHYARRRSAMRLLWLASFRLTQIIAEEHPLHHLRQELQLHRLCEEILLDPFSESEVAQFVATRSGGKAPEESFIQALHSHTDGLPLFVVSVLESLLGSDGNGTVDGWQPTDRALPVPDSLAGAVEKHLAKLPPRERAVLEAASVCGMEFRAATVAELLNLDAGEAIAVCDELVRRQYWLREAGIVDLPGGSVDAKYAFRHAVYKHVFYQRLATAQRVTFHRRAARALERSGVSGTPATPAELASHYEIGREYRAAVLNYRAAAESALGHLAPQEALQLADQGLAQLENCPSDERDELELPLQALRGAGSAVVRGIAAGVTLAAFERVTMLWERLPQTPERALLLNTVGWLYLTRADYEGTIQIADRIRAVGEQFADPMLLIFGYNLAGVGYANSGRFAEGVEALRRGIELAEAHADRLGMAQFYIDPLVSMYANIAPPLTQLGLADQGRAMAMKSVARARRIRQPVARLVANWCACAVAIRLDEPAPAEEHVADLEQLVATTTVQQAIAPARWFRGWAHIRSGRTTEGIALVREGQRLYEESGTVASSTETIGYIVEGHVLERNWGAAAAVLDEAYGYVRRLNERLFITELRLLEARIAVGRGDSAAERRAIEGAVEEARSRNALGAELKARVALVELADSTPAERAALGAAYARLTEGFDTRAAKRARELLAVGA